MATLSSRLCVTGISAVTFVVSLLCAFPARAASDHYRWDWDMDWLKQTDGGFANDFPFDPQTFYYTLPSRSKSFALHPYHRSHYYGYFSKFPPPPWQKKPLTPKELHTCKNFSFLRPNGVPPFGYKCN